MFAFQQAVLASNFKRLSSPFKLSYIVTYRCNLKCRMCNIWDKKDQPAELTPDDVGRFMRRPHRIYWLGITGGEAFLRTDLVDLVEAAIAPPTTIQALHFASNGTLTERIEASVHALRARHRNLKIVFTLSVDGDPETHNKIRGVADVWSRTMRTYKMLKKLPGVKPQFGFTLSQHNIGQFDKMFAALKDNIPGIAFDDITVNIFQRSGFYYDNSSMPDLDPDAVESEIAHILAIDKDRLTLNNFLRRRYLALYRKFLKTRRSPVRCQSMASTCVLDPFGNIFPCSVYERKLVNIKETPLSFKALWQQAQARKIHGECAANKCPGCWSPCDAYSAIGGSLIRSLAAA